MFMDNSENHIRIKQALKHNVRNGLLRTCAGFELLNKVDSSFSEPYSDFAVPLYFLLCTNPSQNEHQGPSDPQ